MIFYFTGTGNSLYAAKKGALCTQFDMGDPRRIEEGT